MKAHFGSSERRLCPRSALLVSIPPLEVPTLALYLMHVIAKSAGVAAKRRDGRAKSISKGDGGN
jgi:hypothetical protein